MRRTRALIRSRMSSGWKITRSTSASGTRSAPVTTAAISRTWSVAALRPVISRSIQTRRTVSGGGVMSAAKTLPENASEDGCFRTAPPSSASFRTTDGDQGGARPGGGRQQVGDGQPLDAGPAGLLQVLDERGQRLRGDPLGGVEIGGPESGQHVGDGDARRGPPRDEPLLVPLHLRDEAPGLEPLADPLDDVGREAVLLGERLQGEAVAAALVLGGHGRQDLGGHQAVDRLVAAGATVL